MARSKRKEVMDAVHKKALGFETVECRVTKEKDASGKRKEKIERTTKSVPPDLEAARMWMQLSGGEGGRLTVISKVPRDTEG